MIMEDFVSFELAKKLKEKGFKEKCIAYYWEKINERRPLFVLEDNMPEYGLNLLDLLSNHNQAEWSSFIDAPTIHQVLKWLRKEKGLFVTINIGYCYETNEIPFPNNPKIEPILKGYYYGIWELDNLNDKNAHSEYFESPELAAIAGIKYVLDNLI